mmetsp:Transcript_110878/g.174843  ORF Transcript_110878/g.174843 Transcript_110878/m.174843 type:complete len:195 (+) Transcript_110878:61-645(+)
MDSVTLDGSYSPSNRTKRRSLQKSSDAKLRKDTVAEAQELVGQLASKLAYGENERDAVVEDLQQQQVAYKHALEKLDAELAEQRLELESQERELQVLRKSDIEASKRLTAAAEVERRSVELEEEVKTLRAELSQHQETTTSVVAEPEPEAMPTSQPVQKEHDLVGELANLPWDQWWMTMLQSVLCVRTRSAMQW